MQLFGFRQRCRGDIKGSTTNLVRGDSRIGFVAKQQKPLSKMGKTTTIKENYCRSTRSWTSQINKQCSDPSTTVDNSVPTPPHQLNTTDSPLRPPGEKEHLPPMVGSWNSKNSSLTNLTTRQDFPTAVSPSRTSLK